MKLVRRMLTQVGVSAGADNVFLWCPIPQGMSLDRVHMNVQIAGVTQPLWKQGCQYVVDGYIIDVPDPDQSTAIVDPNTLWDQQVPKDLDYGGDIELDTDDNSVTAPTETPGGFINPTAMFGGYEPRRIFSRIRTLLGSNPMSVPVSATQWQALDRIRTSFSPRHRAVRPQVALFAIGSPDLGAAYDAFVDGTNERQEWLPTSIQEWFALMNGREVLRQWLLGAQGITDGITDALIYALQRFAEQAYIEDDGSIIDQAYDVTGEATFELSGGASVPNVLTSRPGR